MIYQRSAQKYNWKAISILHEKAKLILAQRGPRVAARARARGGPCTEAASGEEAHTRWYSYKNAPRLWAKQPAVHVTISIDNDFAMEHSNLSPLYNDKVLDHPRVLRHGEQWHWRLRRPHGTHADLSTRPTLT